MQLVNGIVGAITNKTSRQKGTPYLEIVVYSLDHQTEDNKNKPVYVAVWGDAFIAEFQRRLKVKDRVQLPVDKIRENLTINQEGKPFSFLNANFSIFSYLYGGTGAGNSNANSGGNNNGNNNGGGNYNNNNQQRQNNYQNQNRGNQQNNYQNQQNNQQNNYQNQNQNQNQNYQRNQQQQQQHNQNQNQNYNGNQQQQQQDPVDDIAAFLGSI